jgi:hypothetical protein
MGLLENNTLVRIDDVELKGFDGPAANLCFGADGCDLCAEKSDSAIMVMKAAKNGS